MVAPQTVLIFSNKPCSAALLPRTWRCCSQSCSSLERTLPSTLSSFGCLENCIFELLPVSMFDFDHQTRLILYFLLFSNMIKGIFTRRQQETDAGFQSWNVSIPRKQEMHPTALPPAACLLFTILCLPVVRRRHQVAMCRAHQVPTLLI